MNIALEASLKSDLVEFRRVYSSRYFILPVVFLTLLYNIPKFFELYVKESIL
jgi:hypothetical protein